jgi:O-antigen ligase
VAGSSRYPFPVAAEEKQPEVMNITSKLIRQDWFTPEFLLLAAVMITVPLHVRWGNIAMITLAAYSIFRWWKDGAHKMDWRDHYIVLFPAMLFFAYLIGMLWADNLKDGWAQVEKRLPMLFLPLSVWLLAKRLQPITIRRLLYVFLAFCAVLSVLCYAHAIDNIVTNHSFRVVGEKERTYYYYSYIYLTESIDISPIYLSLYVNFCILILVFIPLHNRYVNALAILYFSVFVFLIGSKIGILWLPLFLVLYLGTLIRNKIVLAGVLTVVVIAIYVLIQRADFLRERFFASLEYDYTLPHSSNWNSTSQRLAIWNCTWEAIENQFPWGYGTGSGQTAVDDIYHSKGYIRGYEDHYNAHNEFLSTVLDLGLPGLLVLIVTMIVPLIKGVRTSDRLLAFSLVLIVFYFFIEVIFARRMGIIFFSLFYPLVALSPGIRLAQKV